MTEADEPSLDRSTKRILSGKSWEEFCDILKAAGRVVLGPGTPESAFDKAEGFRYLSRITRAALETFVENADPRAPVLQRVVHETAKMGSDNPDNYYQNAAISGGYEYRIRGRRNTVKYLGFSTQIGHYGQGAGMPPSGFLDSTELDVEADGRFEIIVSCDKPANGVNWLPMHLDSGTLIVRQTFGDRGNEQRAELTIERVGGDPRPTPVTPASIDEGLQNACMLVGGAARLFANWAQNFQRHSNELPQFDPDLSTAFGGDPNIIYYHSYWRLEPDQALLIEVSPPDCEHWNFQLNNHWMESLDYRYFTIHTNKFTARYRDDGSIRIIVAHQKPAAAALKGANWIDTVGHARGTMCFRWIRPEDLKNAPQPKVSVVAFAELQG